MNHCSSIENVRRYQNQRVEVALGQVQRKPVYWLDDIRYIGGVSLIRAFMRNCGNLCSNDKGKVQAAKIARLKTEVLHRDGLTCSSDEAAVMAVERRS